jgi:hypothetical protein
MCDAVTEPIAEKCHDKCNHCRVLVLSSMALDINENILLMILAVLYKIGREET